MIHWSKTEDSHTDTHRPTALQQEAWQNSGHGVL